MKNSGGLLLGATIAEIAAILLGLYAALIFYNIVSIYFAVVSPLVDYTENNWK